MRLVSLSALIRSKRFCLPSGNHAKLYSREADPERLSRDGMSKVVMMFGKLLRGQE